MLQFKEMAIKLTAGAYKHSCKPCTASVYDQDASHAVHPVSSLDTNNLSLPAEAYRYPTPPNDDQLNSQAVNQGSARGDSLNSVHTSLLDQKFNVSPEDEFDMSQSYSNWRSNSGFFREHTSVIRFMDFCFYFDRIFGKLGSPVNPFLSNSGHSVV